MKKIISVFILNFVFHLSYGQNSRDWGSYYGGTSEDWIASVATDLSGNVYIAGETQSTTGIASGGFQNTFGGTQDAFLAKFDAAGNRLWATYYGGPDDDRGFCVTTDASGNVFLAGRTSSNTGIASGGFQNSPGGGSFDGFLVKFDAAGNRLWATYYGGSGDDCDYNCSLAADKDGNIYLASHTTSASGIASGGFMNNYVGALISPFTDAFLVKFDSEGNRLWGTYYGDAGVDYGNGVATDASGNVYLCGSTNSTTNISSGGFQNSFSGGNSDAYVVKFSPSGNRLWATYYGGSGNNGANSVTTDINGNVYIAGNTSSTTNISSGGFQNSFSGGNSDAYVVKFSPSGNRLWATYYGGTSDDYANSVSTDALGNVYIGGDTRSATGFSTINGFQSSFAGLENAFVVKFNDSGTRLSATLYGSYDEVYDHIAVDTSGNIFLSGITGATATGIVSGGFQNTFGGGTTDAFFVKFSSFEPNGIEESKLFNNIIITPNPFSSQASITFSQEQKNTSIDIIDLFGKKIKKINFNGKQLTIEKGEIKNGIYFVQVIDGNTIINRKIIIQ